MSEALRGSCTDCGSAQPSLAWRCQCGGVYDLPDLPTAGFRKPRRPHPAGGVLRYARWIPVPERSLAQISMGEGDTPLIPAGDEVFLKLEYVSPTLSFKDRGAVVLVASALERGAQRLVADSSGNAGAAIAAYAARAGLRCQVFVPARTSAGKQAQIRAFGARVEIVAGDRTETTDTAIASLESSGAMYASHIYDPLFLQGTKTFAFEIVEQLGAVPDSVVVPAGNGTLVLGAARGFRELRAAGVIERAPPLIAVQSERCAPLAIAWARGASTPAPVDARPTVAEGIAIPRPARGAQIISAVASTGGCIVSVPEKAIGPAQHVLARSGLFVEPTAAITWAAASLARGASLGGEVRPDGAAWERASMLAAGRLVVPLCGSGLKSS